MPLAEVTYADVTTWVQRLAASHLAPASVRNPATGVRLPRVIENEKLFLSHDQVADSSPNRSLSWWTAGRPRTWPSPLRMGTCWATPTSVGVSSTPAARAAGLEGLTPHELRHTAASLAVAAGANIKAVQQMLGHASAAMTLDVYAGLFADDLDAVAERLDAAVTRRRADSVADFCGLTAL